MSGTLLASSHPSNDLQSQDVKPTSPNISTQPMDQMEASQIIDGVLDMLNEQAQNISTNHVSQSQSPMCTHCGVIPIASSDESICETCWTNPGAVMSLLQ